MFKVEEHDEMSALEYAAKLLREYQYMRVLNGIEGLCLGCYRSEEEGCEEDCELNTFLDSIYGAD